MKQTCIFYFTLSILLSSCLMAKAQDFDFNEEKPGFQVTQYYLSAGLGKTYITGPDTKNSLATLLAQATIGFSNQYLLRAAIQHNNFFDNSLDYPGSNKTKIPLHTINHYSLAVGKRFELTKHLQANLLTGFSYNIYLKPENISHQGSYGFSLFGSGYDYNEKKYRSPGLLLQSEILIKPFKRSGGISTGVSSHLSPHFATAGGYLAINFGKL